MGDPMMPPSPEPETPRSKANAEAPKANPSKFQMPTPAGAKKDGSVSKFEDSKSVIQSLSKHSNRSGKSETKVPKLDLSPGVVVYRDKKDLKIEGTANPVSPGRDRKVSIVKDQQGSFLELSFKNEPKVDPLETVKEEPGSPDVKKDEEYKKVKGEHAPVDEKMVDACNIEGDKGDDFDKEMGMGELFEVKVKDDSGPTAV